MPGALTNILQRASYSLAFYALLRPTKYMLTPRHNTFDECRHMRACDVQFKLEGRTLAPDAVGAPDSFTVNIMMSKNDQTRGGSTALIGATGLDTCPINVMWSYFKQAEPPADGPLFVSNGYALQYSSSLKLAREQWVN